MSNPQWANWFKPVEPAWSQYIKRRADRVGARRAYRQERKRSFLAGFMYGSTSGKNAVDIEQMRAGSVKIAEQAEELAANLRYATLCLESQTAALQIVMRIESILAEQGNRGLSDSEALSRIVWILEKARA